MQREVDRLDHMLSAARRAVQIANNCNREDLNEDDVVALALTRVLEVLGEAAKAVSPETRAGHPEVPWARMAATRDRLIHGYFTIDLDVVWKIVRYDLPPVVEVLQEILADME